jgi:hypothetical protein
MTLLKLHRLYTQEDYNEFMNGEKLRIRKKLAITSYKLLCKHSYGDAEEN